MKRIYLITILFIPIILIACDNNKPKTISASATAIKDESGKIITRDATKAEIDSLHDFQKKIQKINALYPAPPTPFKQESFAVKTITEHGIFILENGIQLKMSGIKCSAKGVNFIKKFFAEDTERLSYLKEKFSSDGIIEAYIWAVDSSMMNDPEMKQYNVGPSFSGLNDTVILNNWCEIEPESDSKYYLRYIALDKISRKNER